MRCLDRAGRVGVVVALLLGVAAAAEQAVAAGAFAVESAECALQGVDDRCETWAAVYDDDEMYHNSLMPGQGTGAWDHLRGMVASPTGKTVFTFGKSCLEAHSSVCRWGIVAHRAATGDELWVAQVELVTRGIELVDIAVSADGKRVYVTGTMSVARRDGDGDPLRNTDVLTVAYDAAKGKRLWRKTFAGTPVGHRQGDPHDLHAEEGGVAVVASPTDDRVYVTGYSDHRDGFYDVLVLAYDGATGSREWASTYDRVSSAVAYPDDKALPQLAAVSPDGKTLYMGGVSCDPESRSTPCEYLLLAYQAHDPGNPANDGRRRWVRRLGTGGSLTWMELAPDGARIYVTGRGRDPENPNREIIGAYSTSTGQRLWTFEHPEGRPVSIAVSPTGDAVFAVSSGYESVAVDAATGEPGWTASYGRPDKEGVEAAALGVSPDGRRVYVTGTITGDTDAATGRQATVAYDAATGEQQWVGVYNRPLDTETGQLLVVGVDGTVFTAGTLSGTSRSGLPTGNLSDWGVQAYAPDGEGPPAEAGAAAALREGGVAGG